MHVTVPKDLRKTIVKASTQASIEPEDPAEAGPLTDVEKFNDLEENPFSQTREYFKGLPPLRWLYLGLEFTSLFLTIREK